MEKKLELIRRNYYNPKSSITLGLYKLELWLCDLHQAA